MYRVQDKSSAIKEVQRYLRGLEYSEIFVAPSGIYDENTRMAVIDFQASHGLDETGVVDILTFGFLYSEYVREREKDKIRSELSGFIRFPITPASYRRELIHINRTLAAMLEHYGMTHSLRSSNFYSEETGRAVVSMRGIYRIGDENIIDEEFYHRLVKDSKSAGLFSDFMTEDDYFRITGE